MIDLKSVHFKYSGVDDIVSNISLCIDRGECILITGPSGSGKSTITRILNGLAPHFYEGELRGTYILDKRDTKDLNSWEFSHSIGNILQDTRSQFFSTTLVDEMALGLENSGVCPKEIKSRINHVSKELDITKLLNRDIETFSSGEKQRAALGVAMSLSPQVLLFDEPTSNLDLDSILKLKRVIAKYKSRGYTVVVVDHRLHYLMDLVDRVYYIGNGKIKDYKNSEFKRIPRAVMKQMGLRKRTIDFKLNSKDIVKEPLVEVKSLNFRYKKSLPTLVNINFKLYPGIATGLIGSNGQGKTTIARILTGLLKENSGSILFNNKLVHHKRRKSHCFFVMQDSDCQLFTDTVLKELLLGNSGKENIENILKDLGLWEFRDKHPASLSGGQKQRLTLAVALMQDCNTIILDGLTSGLDSNNLHRVVNCINKMKKVGKSILIITHDHELIEKACDNILKLEEGVIVTSE